VPEEQWKQELLDQIQRLQQRQGDGQPNKWIASRRLAFDMLSQFQWMCMHGLYVTLTRGPCPWVEHRIHPGLETRPNK
jgi:hypothetical protein